MTKFTTQSICIYETLIRERRFGTSLCPPLIESIQSTLQNSNNNSLTLWCSRIIFTTHLHTFLFRNICDKSAQNLIMKGWLLQVWLCISNDTLPERITCMLRKSWVISSFDSKILWKNLYQFWGHRLWTLAFAPGISSGVPLGRCGSLAPTLHRPPGLLIQCELPSRLLYNLFSRICVQNGVISTRPSLHTPSLITVHREKLGLDVLLWRQVVCRFYLLVLASQVQFSSCLLLCKCAGAVELKGDVKQNLRRSGFS